MIRDPYWQGVADTLYTGWVCFLVVAYLQYFVSEWVVPYARAKANHDEEAA
jgi:hypothetical protein